MYVLLIIIHGTITASIVCLLKKCIPKCVLVCFRTNGPTKALAQTSSVRKKEGGGRGNPTGVPVLALPNGEVLVDSWSIANHSLPNSAMEVGTERHKFYDTELGPDTRSLAYHLIFNNSATKKLFNKLCTLPRFGGFWSFLWRMGVGSKLSDIMSKSFKTRDLLYRSKLQESIKRHFGKMSDIVDNRKGTEQRSSFSPTRTLHRTMQYDVDFCVRIYLICRTVH